MSHSEVERLIHGYCRALDRLDAELLRSLFHADAMIDMGAIYRGGPDGFVPVAMDFMRSMKATRHCVSNMFEIDGGVESYVDAWHLIERDGASHELLVRARYLQRVEERTGKWGFAFHSEVIDFGEERRVDPGWFAGDIGMPRGSRDGSDPSRRLQTV